MTVKYLLEVTFDEEQYYEEGIRMSIQDNINLGEGGLKCHVTLLPNRTQEEQKENNAPE